MLNKYDRYNYESNDAICCVASVVVGGGIENTSRISDQNDATKSG